MEIMKCKCCNREQELRYGVCFDCANAESIITEGIDMWDNEIPKQEELSLSLSKVKYILNLFNVIKREDESNMKNKQQTEVNAFEYLFAVNQFVEENKTDEHKKQMTAIDWLINELERKDKGLINTPYNRIFYQAKKMEKQKIKEAHTHNRCINNQTYDCTIEAFYNAEQYYNETFNK
jgi:hypothetical protein